MIRLYLFLSRLSTWIWHKDFKKFLVIFHKARSRCAYPSLLANFLLFAAARAKKYRLRKRESGVGLISLSCKTFLNQDLIFCVVNFLLRFAVIDQIFKQQAHAQPSLLPQLAADCAGDLS